MNLIELATHTQNTLEQTVARINTLAAEHEAALSAKNAELAVAQTALNEKIAYQAAMEQRVTSVLQSGDPAQYEALARDFLTPAQEKERLAKLARIEALRAEAIALETELA
jgi:hypothetical protein